MHKVWRLSSLCIRSLCCQCKFFVGNVSNYLEASYIHHGVYTAYAPWRTCHAYVELHMQSNITILAVYEVGFLVIWMQLLGIFALKVPLSYFVFKLWLQIDGFLIDGLMDWFPISWFSKSIWYNKLLLCSCISYKSPSSSHHVTFSNFNWHIIYHYPGFLYSIYTYTFVIFYTYFAENWWWTINTDTQKRFREDYCHTTTKRIVSAECTDVYPDKLITSVVSPGSPFCCNPLHTNYSSVGHTTTYNTPHLPLCSHIRQNVHQSYGYHLKPKYTTTATQFVTRIYSVVWSPQNTWLNMQCVCILLHN